jgi:hypothetical protein
MNPQNAQTMDAMTLPSPLPTQQLFSAGAPSVESHTNLTRAAATHKQRGSTEHNSDCTIIKLATYNIQDGRNSNLEACLRACEQMRIDIGVLTETRLSTDRYTRSAYGYMIFATQTVVAQHWSTTSLHVFLSVRRPTRATVPFLPAVLRADLHGSWMILDS